MDAGCVLGSEEGVGVLDRLRHRAGHTLFEQHALILLERDRLDFRVQAGVVHGV